MRQFNSSSQGRKTWPYVVPTVFILSMEGLLYFKDSTSTKQLIWVCVKCVTRLQRPEGASFLKRPEVRIQADWNSDQPANPFVLPERLNQECLDFKAILAYVALGRYVNKQRNQGGGPRGQGKRALLSFSALRAGNQDLLEWLVLCSLGYLKEYSTRSQKHRNLP